MGQAARLAASLNSSGKRRCRVWTAWTSRTVWNCTSCRGATATRSHDRDWDRLADIFTVDAVFDMTDLGARRCEGLDDIKRFMDTEAEHPKTHLMTNVYVDEAATGVQLRFRIVADAERRPDGHGVVLRRCREDAARLACGAPRRHVPAPPAVSG